MFDIDTLYVSSAVSRASFAVVFVVSILSRPSERYLRHWTYALLASIVAALLIIPYAKRPILPPLLAVLVLSLFLSSLAASWSGLRLFYGRAVRMRSLPLLGVAPSVLFAAAVAADAPARLTLPFIFLFAAFLAGLALYEVVTAPDRRLLSQYVIAVAFAGYSLVLLLSAVLILAGLMPADAGQSSVSAMVFDQAASILIYFGYIAMSGERAALNLKQQAETDPLTGLANRRGGTKLLQRLQAGADAGGVYSVLIGDVDHFKQINDSLGHEAGDTVLMLLAQRLGSGLRRRDRAVRWGGEEFLIVLPETRLEEAERLAERLRACIETMPFVVGRQSLAITLSLGVAETGVGDANFEAAIQRADRALYQAKREGRNRICTARPAAG